MGTRSPPATSVRGGTAPDSICSRIRTRAFFQRRRHQRVRPSSRARSNIELGMVQKDSLEALVAREMIGPARPDREIADEVEDALSRGVDRRAERDRPHRRAILLRTRLESLASREGAVEMMDFPYQRARKAGQ